MIPKASKNFIKGAIRKTTVSFLSRVHQTGSVVKNRVYLWAPNRAEKPGVFGAYIISENDFDIGGWIEATKSGTAPYRGRELYDILRENVDELAQSDASIVSYPFCKVAVVTENALIPSETTSKRLKSMEHECRFGVIIPALIPVSKLYNVACTAESKKDYKLLGLVQKWVEEKVDSSFDKAVLEVNDRAEAGDWRYDFIEDIPDDIFSDTGPETV